MSEDGEMAQEIEDIIDNPEAQFVIGQVQVLLSLKRTALVVVQTGAIFTSFALAIIAIIFLFKDEFTNRDYIIIIVSIALLIYSRVIIYHSRKKITEINKRIHEMMALVPSLEETFGDLIDD